MKKRFLILPILFILCALFTLSCNESSDTEDPKNYPKASEGLQFEINEEDGTCAMVGTGECTDTHIVAPQEYKGYKVTSIEMREFNSNIENFTIPNTVNFIESSYLKYVTNIRFNYYEGGWYLGNPSNPYMVLVNFEDTEASVPTIHKDTRLIHMGAISHDIKKITIPKNVKYVGQGSFNAKTVEKISVEAGNKYYYVQNNCLIEKESKKLVAVAKGYKIPKDVKMRWMRSNQFLLQMLAPMKKLKG